MSLAPNSVRFRQCRGSANICLPSGELTWQWKNRPLKVERCRFPVIAMLVYWRLTFCQLINFELTRSSVICSNMAGRKITLPPQFQPGPSNQNPTMITNHPTSHPFVSALNLHDRCPMRAHHWARYVPENRFRISQRGQGTEFQSARYDIHKLQV